MTDKGGGVIKTSSPLSVYKVIENFLYEMYLNLMEAGHSMSDIDNTDMEFYINMLEYKQEKEKRKKIQSMDNAGV